MMNSNSLEQTPTGTGLCLQIARLKLRWLATRWKRLTLTGKDCQTVLSTLDFALPLPPIHPTENGISDLQTPTDAMTANGKSNIFNSPSLYWPLLPRCIFLVPPVTMAGGVAAGNRT
jgi:hypothetical protein